MGILQVDDATKTLEYGRGDSFETEITVKNKAGSEIDISGFTFALTVNTAPDPSDNTNEVFTVAGVINDALNGKVGFSPTDTDTDISPDTYFYDIQMIDAASKKRTIVIAQFLITQDITKA
jgi:hypothetical protein